MGSDVAVPLIDNAEREEIGAFQEARKRAISILSVAHVLASAADVMGNVTLKTLF